MRDSSDMELVRDYVRQSSEAAFAELVQRHVNLVYSAALRHTGIAAQAEEITQAVFIILARKAAALRDGTVVEAWLYETTRLTALSHLRAERRRQFREQEAYMQSSFEDSASDPLWHQMAPVLDEAMLRLGQKEREALVLRYFKDKSLRETATGLNISEAAAQKRVNRALEKLHHYFGRRGISSTTAIIAGEIATNSVQIAPVGLAKVVTATAITKGAAASASTLTLIKGALKIMAWSKAKTAVVAGVVVLLAIGTGTVAVKEFQKQLPQAQPQSHLAGISSNIIRVSPDGTVQVVSLSQLNALSRSNRSKGEPANVNGSKWGNAMRRSEAVWANRPFFDANNEDALSNAISAMTGGLRLDPAARAAASESCYRLLVAYSTGDWDMFKSVRIPSTNYVISEHALTRFLKGRAGQATTALDQYQTLWSKMFASRPLFDHVSFIDDSVSVFNLPVNQVPGLGFPTFTAATNQNWISMSPTPIIVYSQKESVNSNDVSVLRFFFFGKIGNEVNLYKVLFVWDTNESVWLPWRLTIAYAPPSAHQLSVF